MYIWIVNPFEEFPVGGTTPLRYGTLCKVLAERGHEVIWWSSDFSHLTKTFRPVPAENDGFAYRLISTTSYRRHVGLARWRSHRRFALKFRESAQRGIETNELGKPDLVVVSLPPLGIAREAFRLRKLWGCRVVIDIVDAWPETFLRLVPGGDRIGRLLLGPFFAEARRAYLEADGMAAVARTFLELPQNVGSKAPVHLTYLGGELEDRVQKSEVGSQRPEGGGQPAEDGKEKKGESVQSRSAGPNFQHPEGENEAQNSGGELNQERRTKNQEHAGARKLRFVYIGAMARSYDLETVLAATKKLKAAGNEFELHLAGAGPKEPALRAFVEQNKLKEHVTFHGYLGLKELKDLLAQADVAINPVFDNSWIAFPYKMSEYMSAGLAVINSLSGEVKGILDTCDAGVFYPAGDAAALAKKMDLYCKDPGLARRHGNNARKFAELELDRSKTYPKLAKFLEEIARKN